MMHFNNEGLFIKSVMLPSEFFFDNINMDKTKIFTERIKNISVNCFSLEEIKSEQRLANKTLQFST